MRSYFGRHSDQLGRKRLLIITLLLYLFGTGLAAFTVNDGGWLWLAWFYGTRFIAGMGIGGQYAAINSAIDEMMPSKYRGRVDIWINGSYWAGAILGSFASLVFLNAFAPNVGWRLAFLLGPVLALVVIFVGRTLPESPRWLMTHGRVEEAEKELAKIEEIVRSTGQELEPVDDSMATELDPEKRYGYVTFLGLVFRTYPKRAVLGATLMITQSFLYNAIYFTYGLVLVQFYGVSADKVPLYGLAFAVGNLCGPLILAPLFDSVGRKPMISGTYIISGVLLAISGWLFDRGDLDATTQTFCWVIIFFFASAGASAAYLTVSETWLGRPSKHPNVTLRTNARVVRLETNGEGTAVTEVVVERDGAEERFAGDVVVVACGAANTAKLLLQSASDKHPNGLANGSDQVGRNYMFHDSTAVLALSREENPTVFQKTLALNDFYFGDDDFEYPLGNVQMVGKSTAAMFRGERPRDTKLAPEWTLERMARHAIDFWLSTEDLPQAENRVTVEPDGNIKLTYAETNLEAKKRLYEKVKSMLGKLDMNPGHLIHRFAYMKNDIPIAGCAHQAGTCRFGTDPETSVLDVNCKAHELDNLYVVDTSVFPSIGAVNPALTAMANSLRVGDHLLERLR